MQGVGHTPWAQACLEEADDAPPARSPQPVSPRIRPSEALVMPHRTATTPEHEASIGGARTYRPPAKRESDHPLVRQTAQIARGGRPPKDARLPCRQGGHAASVGSGPRRRGIVLPSSTMLPVRTPPVLEAQARPTTSQTARARAHPSPPPSPRTLRRSYRQEIARLLAQHRQLRKHLPPELRGLPAELMEAAHVLGHDGPPVSPEVYVRVNEVLHTLKAALKDNGYGGVGVDAVGAPLTVVATAQHGHFYSAGAAFATPPEHHIAMGLHSGAIGTVQPQSLESATRGGGGGGIIGLDSHGRHYRHTVLQRASGVPVMAASTMKPASSAFSFDAPPIHETHRAASPIRGCDMRRSLSARSVVPARSPRPGGFRSPLRTPPGSARTHRRGFHTPNRSLRVNPGLPKASSTPSMPTSAPAGATAATSTGTMASDAWAAITDAWTASPPRTAQPSPVRSQPPQHPSPVRRQPPSCMVHAGPPLSPLEPCGSGSGAGVAVPTWAWPTTTAGGTKQASPCMANTSATRPPVPTTQRQPSTEVFDWNKNVSFHLEADKSQLATSALLAALPTPSRRARRASPANAVSGATTGLASVKVRVPSPSTVSKAASVNTTSTTVLVSPAGTPSVPGFPPWPTTVVHATSASATAVSVGQACPKTSVPTWRVVSPPP